MTAAMTGNRRPHHQRRPHQRSLPHRVAWQTLASVQNRVLFRQPCLCRNQRQRPHQSAEIKPGCKIHGEGYKTSTTRGQIVLEGMGPPTTGADARSELPTDPTAPTGASVGRTSVVTRISSQPTAPFASQRAAIACAQEVRP
jgi:hypothetical protein